MLTQKCIKMGTKKHLLIQLKYLKMLEEHFVLGFLTMLKRIQFLEYQQVTLKTLRTLKMIFCLTIEYLFHLKSQMRIHKKTQDLQHKESCLKLQRNRY